MIPTWRKPVSVPSLEFKPRHSLRDSIINGISRESLPIWRHQPQLRLDCSQAISPFSQIVTSSPRSESSSAVAQPSMPPPMTTTSVRDGIVLSLAITVGCGIGGENLSGAWMGLPVLLDQMAPVNLGVDLRGRQARVAEKLLNGAKIGA